MSDWYPPPARPRSVEGGLKARSRRGAIGQTWWSGRFVDVVEGIGLGTRLQRGRNYARRGQVVSLEVDAGAVTAVVQGSRARPYRVRIGLATYGKAGWARLEEALAGDAWYAARLLAGEMPEEIEGLFASLDLPLFPTTAADLQLDCTCPDQQVPCKHIAAALYLLAEAFDEDPFSILAWRGRDHETLLANLAAVRSAGAPAADRHGGGRPLAGCLDTFFDMAAVPPMGDPPSSGGPVLIDTLPDLELVVRDRRIADLLRPAYDAFDESS